MTIGLEHKGPRCDKTSFASKVWNWSGCVVKLAGVKFQCIVCSFSPCKRIHTVGMGFDRATDVKKALRFFFSCAPFKTLNSKDIVYIL